jgi:hypothetical protein
VKRFLIHCIVHSMVLFSCINQNGCFVYPFLAFIAHFSCSCRLMHFLMIPQSPRHVLQDAFTC